MLLYNKRRHWCSSSAFCCCLSVIVLRQQHTTWYFINFIELWKRLWIIRYGSLIVVPLCFILPSQIYRRRRFLRHNSRNSRLHLHWATLCVPAGTNSYSVSKKKKSSVSATEKPQRKLKSGWWNHVHLKNASVCSRVIFPTFKVFATSVRCTEIICILPPSYR